MRKQVLGHTKEEVSVFCFGGMYLGTKQDETTSFELLDQYFEAGGNFIDTANIYAWWIPGGQGGESESVIGEWIKKKQNRNSLFLASKVGFGYAGVPKSLRANVIVEECNKTLKRMKIETLDLYYAHCDDRSTPLEETLEAFHNLKKSGKIRYIGASNFLPWRLEEASWISKENNWPTFCCIQQRHSYIRKKPGTNFEPQIAANEELIDYCQNREITLLAYSALLSGSYTREDRDFDQRYLGPDTENRLAALNSISMEIKCSPNQVILAWMLQSSPPIIPLIAASDPHQMSENLDALEIQLTPEQLSRLNSAGP